MVAGTERPGRTSGAGPAGQGGKLAIGDHLAAWDRSQRPLAFAVEPLLELELDVRKVIFLAGEEGRKPRRELVAL